MNVRRLSIIGHVAGVLRVGALSGLAFVVAAVQPLVSAQADDTSPGTTDRTIPEFSLEVFDGGTIDTEALAGKPWVINFWATWCAPCVEEIPSMNIAWESLEPAGVGMLAINVGESAELIEAFMEKVPIDFPVVLGHGATTMPNWGARALPTTLIVDRDGKVVQEALGPRDWGDEQLVARIMELASP